jgi:hypothetical protein
MVAFAKSRRASNGLDSTLVGFVLRDRGTHRVTRAVMRAHGADK